MRQIDVREGARRQHRRIAVFALIQCWIRNLDGLVLNRSVLSRSIGLERIKQTRVRWMVEDFQELFSHTYVKWSHEQRNHFIFLVVSRLPFDETYLSGQKLLLATALEDNAPQPDIEEFRMWEQPPSKRLLGSFEGVVPFFADEVNYDERFLSSQLSLLAEGQISPNSLPPLQEISGDQG